MGYLFAGWLLGVLTCIAFAHLGSSGVGNPYDPEH